MRTLRARSSSLAPFFLGGTGDAGDGEVEGGEDEEGVEERKARRRVLG